VFKPADAKSPPEIAAFAHDMARVESHHPDLFTPAAVERYFEEVYWRKGKELDRDGVLGAFRLSAGTTNFAYRRVAENFRMIESGMLPVIVPHDDEARRVVDRLRLEQVSSGVLARALQGYIVQVPPRARQRLTDCGRVAFESPESRADQFAVLQTIDIYDPAVGLVWEDQEYLAAEALVV
jgi:CRISPR-associated endonuclease/helicase Cas3